MPMLYKPVNKNCMLQFVRNALQRKSILKTKQKDKTS